MWHDTPERKIWLRETDPCSVAVSACACSYDASRQSAVTTRAVSHLTLTHNTGGARHTTRVLTVSQAHHKCRKHLYYCIYIIGGGGWGAGHTCERSSHEDFFLPSISITKLGIYLQGASHSPPQPRAPPSSLPRPRWTFWTAIDAAMRQGPSPWPSRVFNMRDVDQAVEQ